MVFGYKHKTGIFGSAAESYVSRLLWLMKNPDGDRRPDLASVNGNYTPPLSVEVKSGRKMKGVLVDYQLHYAITTEQAYMELFGEMPSKREIKLEMFPNEPIIGRSRISSGNPVAYYYCLINRRDDLTSKEIDRPYSSIRCDWGDMFLVPPEFAFYSFAACRVKRNGEGMGDVVSELKEMVKKDALAWNSEDYKTRKGNLSSWQNIHGRDIKAVFENDLTIATKHGIDRINLISQFWPEIFGLSKVSIVGPNKTNIYILANPEDNSLFDEQVRKKVSERVPIMEKVYRSRRRAISLLEKVSPFQDNDMLLFDSGRFARSMCNSSLTKREIKRLERLVNWLDEEERVLTINPF